MVTYIQSLQDSIAQRIVYPEKARRYGWEGTVKLALHLFRDGTLASASIRESSGYELFDEEALNLVKNLAPYSAFPSEAALQELTVTVPIVYNLDQGSN
jgi:TonB family protein